MMSSLQSHRQASLSNCSYCDQSNYYGEPWIQSDHHHRECEPTPSPYVQSYESDALVYDLRKYLKKDLLEGKTRSTNGCDGERYKERGGRGIDGEQDMHRN